MTSPRIATATAFLFVPATRPERYTRALATSADAVIVDLEDAVAPDAKQAARDTLRAGAQAMSPDDRERILIRINAAGTAWHADDVALAAELVATGVGGVMLSKSETVDTIVSLDRALRGMGCIVALIESGAGLDAINLIAAAPGVSRLAFGHLDFMSDLGMASDGDEQELIPARFAVVQASRRAGIAAPVDGVTTDAKNLERTRQDATRSVRLGFGGKLCIHPDQVDAVREAFAPTQAQIDWATKVIEAAAVNGAVFALEGRMVDAPVIALARSTLARAIGRTAGR